VSCTGNGNYGQNMNERLAHLQVILKECEHKCMNCHYNWEHLMGEKYYMSCGNKERIVALKRVIKKRFGRMYVDKSGKTV
jgi:hypothetical protein